MAYDEDDKRAKFPYGKPCAACKTPGDKCDSRPACGLEEYRRLAAASREQIHRFDMKFSEMRKP